MKLSNREKALIVIAFLLLIVLGYTTLITPYSESVEEKTAQLEALTNEKTLVETKLASLPALQAHLIEAEQERDDAMVYLGTYQNDEALDTVFTAIAKKYSMDVSKLSISDNTTTFQIFEENQPEELAFTAKNVDITLVYKASNTSIDFTPFINFVMELSAREDTVVDSISYIQTEDGSSTTTTALNFVVSAVVFMEHGED